MHRVYEEDVECMIKFLPGDVDGEWLPVLIGKVDFDVILLFDFAMFYLDRKGYITVIDPVDEFLVFTHPLRVLDNRELTRQMARHKASVGSVCLCRSTPSYGGIIPLVVRHIRSH